MTNAATPLVTFNAMPAKFDTYRDFFLWESKASEEVLENAFAFEGTKAVMVSEMEPAIKNFIIGLAAHVEKHNPKAVDFTVAFHGYLFRGHRDQTVSKPILALRRIPSDCPVLTDITMPNIWREIFLWPELTKGGLIILAATKGQGKSTTTAAVIKSRLERFGGFCRTIEDPCELPLHGRHGDGICIQTPVDPRLGEQGFAHALRDALRSYPSIPGAQMCLVGEIRDPETAALALRSAVDGTLMITTLHAGTPETAIGRLLAMAEHVMGEKTARELLGSALRALVHQKLLIRPQQEGWKQGEITGQIVFSKDESSTIASAITTNGNLREAIASQQRILALTPPVKFSEFLSKLSNPSS